MRFIALILAFILCFVGSAISEDIATPTDIPIDEEEDEELFTIEDDDWGEIEIEFERRVFISMEKEPKYLGDEMSLVATLIDFQPEDRYTIYWQYSEDELNWTSVEDEHQQIFTVILDSINCHYSWRVLIKLEECV